MNDDERNRELLKYIRESIALIEQTVVDQVPPLKEVVDGELGSPDE